MLQSISIRNYALIQELDMNFSDGLTIITGETGAGKSILLGALSLVLGARADTSVLKDKENKCFIEAVFSLENFKIKEIFLIHGLDYEVETVLRREISPNGKSRSFINDTPVNLSVLKEIGDRLVDIHSQHQNLNLHDHLYQLNVIDVFSGNLGLLETYKKEYNHYQHLNTQYHELVNRAEKARQDRDYLEFQFKQLEDVGLKDVDEQEKLENEQKALSHAGEIKSSLEKAGFVLNGEENSVILQLKEVENLVQNILQFFPSAIPLHQRVESCYIELKDLAGELESHGLSIEVDPARLEFVNERLDLIYSLQQKYKVSTIKELMEIKNDLDLKLSDLMDYDSRIGGMKKELEQQEKTTKELARELSSKRMAIFDQLSGHVKKILIQLGIPNADFNVKSEIVKEPGENGVDEISFLFSANKNTGLQEIAQVASGGEMSRLMLAIKFLLSQSITLPTIIFDEIDTGVSGEIADKVGTIMQQMSSKLQVINITHLPQIAAKGKEHFKVYKKDEEDGTYTYMKKLEKQERLQEIAKMLSGEVMTSAALENARELLEKS